MNKKTSSRNIPSAIKRTVRQRCGFGCVMCGNPIYDYEHMKEWSVVKEHVAEDITLLCAEHHREKTAGRLPIEIVKKANEIPYNLKQGHGKSMKLYYQGNSCLFDIGGNSFRMASHEIYPSILIALMVDDVPLLSFMLKDQQLYLNANIFDEDNKLILKIVHNELIYSIGVWDITFVGKELTIRQAQQRILFKINFETPNIVRINRAQLFYNGTEITVFRDKLILGNKNIQILGNSFINIPVGIAIGDVQLSAGIRV